MKKVLLVWTAAVALLVSGCYKDDINDLQEEVDRLKQEQQAQAGQIQTLLDALDNKLTIISVTPTGNGTKIVFSDGSSVNVGTSIAKVEEFNNEVFFTLSDGTVIKIHKIETTVLYILSEGSMGGGNSDMAYYDVFSRTLTPHYFTLQNPGAPLGDTGNAMKLYGSKMYCAVSGPDMEAGGFIKIVDPGTGKLIKSIAATGSDGKPDMPRHIAVTGGKVYFSMYSGAVASVDTATLEITGRVKLSGTFSEGICVYGGSLYVCNSGQGPGNTVSVVDIASFTETATIPVPENPSMIEATATGDIYFTTADYSWNGGDRSNLHKFNVAGTGNITTYNIRASRLAIGQDYVYTVDTDWGTMESIVKKVNRKTGEADDFVLDEPFDLGYNVFVSPANGDIYFTNQMGQNVYAYNRDGKQVLSLTTGVQNGSSVVFINR